MVVEKVQFRHFSWLHKVDRLLRILIFHDASTDVESVINMLEHGGFTPVLECVSDIDALRASLERQEWDVVISDSDEAFQSEALKALRLVRNVEFDLPFIMISTDSTEAFVAHAFREGADRFILKSQLGRLVSTIDHELQKLEYRRGFVAKALVIEESCKTLEMMVTGLLHEVQSSMSAEQQLLQFMIQGRFGALEEGQLALLEEIVQSKRQTGQLVENIFWAFADREQKSHEHLELANLNRLIARDIVPAFEQEVKFRQLLLQTDLDPALPEIAMNVPGISLVLKNLIQNALSYTQPGETITLITQVRETYVVCAVESTGTTLEADYIEHLFETCDSSGQLRFRTPAALGLYLSQKILDACHGELGLEIPPESGSSFLVKLPIL